MLSGRVGTVAVHVESVSLCLLSKTVAATNLLLHRGYC